MPISAVIFDLDGTLLNTLDDIADGVNYALREFDFPERTTEEIKTFVGNGAVKLLERSLPEPVNPDLFQDFYRCYDKYYTAHSKEKTQPYDGIMELLQKLKEQGIHTAVFSNKQDNAVRPICAHYFGNLIDYATGPTENTPKKPSYKGIFYIAEQLNVDIHKVLYVGDSETDMFTGLNAGVQTVGVTWGFREKDSLVLSGAKTMVDTPQELLAYILENK